MKFIRTSIIVFYFFVTFIVAEKYHYWYTYATDGNRGVLLDMIVRPSNAAIRLAVYSVNFQKQPVYWEYYPLDQVNYTDNSVSIGKWQLNLEKISVVVHNISISGILLPGPSIMQFMQKWEEKVAQYMLPKIPILKSQYGTIHEMIVDGYRFANKNMAYTTYTLNDIQNAHWFFISTLQFNNTDLIVELAAIPFGVYLLGTGYVQYQQRAYVLNNPFENILEIKITNPGIIKGDDALFGARITIPRKFILEMECSAKKTQFAELDTEGQPIHTTVLGTCGATITDHSGNKFYYVANKTALLEKKGPWE